MRFKQSSKIKYLLIKTALLVLILGSGPIFSQAKTANYYLSSDQIFSYESLAKYDLVIVPVDTELYSRGFFSRARDFNPDIKILAYVPVQSVNVSALGDTRSFNYKLYSKIPTSWYLKDSVGQDISTWPGLKNVNITGEWQNWFPQFVQDNVLNTGVWDGIFYDVVEDGVAWHNSGDVDLDGDHQIDNGVTANNLWQTAMVQILKNSCNIFSDKLIVINGSSLEAYQSYINGRMFEDFPTPWQGAGQWADSMQALNTNFGQVRDDKIFILNSIGEEADYQEMRLGFASSLLSDSYFSYDADISRHESMRWYDEYNINLGQSLNEPYNILNNSNDYSVGVWRRDFDNGLVLVNATSLNQRVELKTVYEKIRGSQDPEVNNGELVQEVVIPPHDGLVLLKRLGTEAAEIGQDDLRGWVFTNGDFVRVFDKRGENKRAGFYAYEEQFAGGVQIGKFDLDQDGQLEMVVAGQTNIKIYNSQNILIKTFYPYGLNYSEGINMDIGNVQGDDKLEIITGPQSGVEPIVKVFDWEGKVLHEGWYAYDKNFYGGVQVTLGDLNGNGYAEIVSGAGFGGGPHVRIFDSKGHLFDPGFFPFDPNFRGGIYVTAADLNGDGKDEIITGAGPSGGPHIQIYDKIGHLVDPGFFAFDSESRTGVKVQALDIDSDGQVEILGMR